VNKKYNKVFSTLSLFSLLFNLFFPTLDAFRISMQARAQETVAQELSPTPVVTPETAQQPAAEPDPTAAPTDAPAVEVTAAPTSEPTTAPTETITAEPTTTIEPTTSTTPGTTQTQEQQKSQDQQQTNTTETPAPTTEVTTTPVPPTATPQLDEQITTTVVKLDGSYADPNLVPSTWTDKADYAPTEKVVVSGKNFLPNTQYSITISSTDEPAVTHNGTFTTTAEGTFTYEYQLDGNYRPNYKVEVKDGSGAVVATTTFTDSVSQYNQCANDTGSGYSSGGKAGCDWINGNLNKNNSAYYEGDSTPQRLYLNELTNGSHTFEIKYGTTKGGKHAYDFITSDTYSEAWISNSDICEGLTGFNDCSSLTPNNSSLIPTDPNAGGHDTAVSDRYFRIRNGSITQIGNPTLISGTYSGDSETSILITFNVNTSSCVNSKKVSGIDTCPVLITWGAHVSKQSDWGAGNSAVNISGSPYHVSLEKEDGSTAGSRDNQMQADAIKGSISLDKVTAPSGDTTSFSFSTTGFTYNQTPSLTDTATPVIWSNLEAGTFTITESVPTQWSLTSRNCTGNIASVITNITNGVSISLASGENVVCTFTNTLINNGSITIVKDAVPNDAQDFAFTTTGTGLSGFMLDDDSDVTRSNTQTFTGLAAGSYSVTEGTATAWSLSDIVCTGTATTSKDLANRKINITLGAGQTTTCTFTNTQDTGTITVNKTLSPSNDAGKFNLSVDGTNKATDVGDGGTTGAVTVLTTGTHTIGESAGAGTTLSDYNSTWACSDATSGTGTSITGKTVAKNTNLTCTFTNTRKTGKLELQKLFIGTTESVTLNIGHTQNGNDVATTTISGNGTTSEKTINTGTYYVSESLTNAGNYGSSLVCYNDTNDNDTIDITDTDHTVNTSTGAVAISENDDVICRYTNTRNRGTIELKKEWTGTAGQTTLNIGTTAGTSDVDTQLTGANGTSPLTTGQNTVDTGTYFMSETGGLTNYSSALSCFNDTNDNGTNDTESSVTVGTDNAVVVASGQHVICTFVNTRNTGTLIVHKMIDTDGDGAYDVASDTGANTLGFRWGYSTTPATNTTDFGGSVLLDTDTYSLYENSVSGYHVTGWYPTTDTQYSCTSPKGTSLPASATVTSGNTTEITICNARDTGTIQVVKDVDPDDSKTSSWDFEITGSTNNTANGIHDTESSTVFTSTTGNYSIEETGTVLGDYTTTYECLNGSNSVTSGTGTTASFTLSTGMNVVCTFTNSVKKGKIIVKKSMVGGTGSFTFTGDVAGTISSNNGTLSTKDVLPGTYSATESAATGWELSSITCDDTNSTGNTTTRTASFDVQPGETVTCTFVNSKLPTLTVIKHVENDNGGEAVASNFMMTISQGVTTVTSFAGNESGVTTTLVPGTYSVDEGANTLYAKSMSGDCTDVVLAYGDAKTCTITNDDVKPLLTLKKVVVNDNGGTAQDTDWTLTATGPTTFSGAGIATSGASFDAGTYTLSESTGPDGYIASNWVCNDVELKGNTVEIGLGDNITCVITNDDQTAHLTVIKHVINDNGGTKVAADFTMGVTGTNVSDTGFSGDESGTTVTLNAGSYKVSESGPSGYTASFSSNCESTIALGETKTCTVTNDDNMPSLTLTKVVENNHGGTAVATDWTLTADGPTDISGEGGATSGSSFDAGTYTLSESAGPTGYTNGSWNCTNNVSVNANNEIKLGLGESTECTVYNSDQPATLFVKKHVINDNGGTLEAKDFDLTVNGTNAAPTAFVGNEDGTEITLDAGTYSVDEPSVPTGYKMTGNDCAKGTIDIGETKTCTITNDDTFGKVQVTKFNDLDGDGIQDEGEAGMNNWEITLTDWKNQKTDQDGFTEFSPVVPGGYTLGEVQQTGWKLTGINCNTITPTPTEPPNPNDTPTPTPTPATSKMNICHYNASNGRWNAQQISSSAWPTHQGHGNGTVYDYTYGGPLAQNGHPAPHTGDQWCLDHQNDQLNRTSLFGVKSVMAVSEDNETSTTKDITVRDGETVVCTIGNQFIEPKLIIAKSNNKELIDQSPGADVTYTLTVTAEDNNVNGVTVTDLPPKGFAYRGGSWTATSSLHGPLSIPEPTYHSPGTWTLGDMEVGEVITLTYVTDISNDQKPGTYRDLALAQGTSDLETEVIANDTTGTFVGTNVTVVKSTQLDTTVNVKREEKRESTGEVLGASTSLPSTGADNAWTFASLALTLAGLLAFVFGLGMNRKKLGQVVGVLLTVVTAGMIVGKTYAITNTSIRLSQPKTPINQTFTLSFVALDLLDREITVRCYKKGPSDGGYSQFGGDIALIAGGNSGECPITDSLLASNGTYSFYATATATGDSEVTSPTVSVDFNEDAPSTPTSYSKSKVGSCEYKITFHTANDSDTRKTAKVEIYRSENTSFAVDGSNKVGEVSIGPNEDGSFTNTVPDCGKTYYYVIRAFNLFGNGSGVIGDSEVTVTTISSTTTTTTTSTTQTGGAVPVENANVAPGTGEEQVLGEQTGTSSEEGQILGEKEEAQKGSVLGKLQDAVKKNKYLWIYVLIAAVAALGLGYAVYKKTQDRNDQ
jgi:hypothetical protein